MAYNEGTGGFVEVASTVPSNRQGASAVYDDIAVSKFWSKVVRGSPDECWVWTGSRTRGYGRFQMTDRPRPAHRISWEIANGMPFPSGKIGCHKCDNPSCVNPAHIWPGTDADNMRDASNKGRMNNQKKTHCMRGHEFTPENTGANSYGGRFCRICMRASQTKYNTKRYAKERALKAQAGENGSGK